MGQSQSADQELPNYFSQNEPLNTLLSEEIINLTYEQFLFLLKELNTLSRQTLDANGKQLAFAIKKGTYSTVFWKATIQIACVKLDPATEKIETYRLISLQEFLKIFKTLKLQISAAEQSKSHEELVTHALDSLSLESESSGDSLTECCICFERKKEIILPCTHSYCTQCIDEWGESHDTCPICRERMGNFEDDAWVLSEVPKSEEIEEEIKESLMELTEDRSPPCSPS